MTVRPVSADEVARVEAAGTTLGIDAPIVDGRLRHIDGVCVFLEADDRCAIHRHLGAAAKPAEQELDQLLAAFGEIGNPPSPEPSPPARKAGPDARRSVFIAGLPNGCTPADVEWILSRYGELAAPPEIQGVSK